MKHFFCTIAAVSLVFLCPTRDTWADDPVPEFRQVDFHIDSDPVFQSWDSEVRVSNDAIRLWMAAIDRNDVMLQRMAVDTIAVAHQRAMPGIDATLPKLIELAQSENTSPIVRKSAVRAIIEFDAKEQASMLAAVAETYGQTIAASVEPALVKWKSPVMRDRWMQRLQSTGDNRQMLILAIQGMGALQDAEAQEELSAIAMDKNLSDRVRLEASGALGQCTVSGLLGIASRLVDSADGRLQPALMAVAMLRRHTDQGAIDLLKRLIVHDSTVVQSEALTELYRIDSSLLLDCPAELIVSTDVNVRRLIAKSWIDAEDSQWIEGLARYLDDVNPGLRNHVARELFRLAHNPDLRDAVVSHTTGVLDQDSWRGCEQAGLVLVNLNQKQCGDRLVDLLRHPRGEVMVTAGWGLRKFAEQKHLPAMLGRAQEIHAGFRSGALKDVSPGVVDLISQLFLAFAEMEYHECDDVVRAYLPRNFDLGERARASAALAVGFLYRDQQPKDLVDLLVERLKDIELPMTEYELVRESCARSLGRMKAEAALPTLRRFATEYGDFTSRSCHWSIEILTGKQPPDLLPPIVVDYTDWFLMPVGEAEE